MKTRRWLSRGEKEVLPTRVLNFFNENLCWVLKKFKWKSSAKTGSLILNETRYGVASIDRMLKNIGLFCKRDLQKRPIFCKETYIFKHPMNRSHPIVGITRARIMNTGWDHRAISYGVAMISRLLKNIGLFCKRALQKRPIFCNETHIFKEPTNRCHPIRAFSST